MERGRVAVWIAVLGRWWISLRLVELLITRKVLYRDRVLLSVVRDDRAVGRLLPLNTLLLQVLSDLIFGLLSVFSVPLNFGHPVFPVDRQHTGGEQSGGNGKEYFRTEGSRSDAADGGRGEQKQSFRNSLCGRLVDSRRPFRRFAVGLGTCHERDSAPAWG